MELIPGLIKTLMNAKKRSLLLISCGLIRSYEKHLKLIAGVHECDLVGEEYTLLTASAGALAKASIAVVQFTNSLGRERMSPGLAHPIDDNDNRKAL